MKTWSFLVCLSLIAVFTRSAKEQEKLVFAAPNSYTIAFGAERVIKKALLNIGIQMELKRFPAERSLSLANDGTVDGEIIRIGTLSKQYPNLLLIPVSIATGHVVVFTKDTDFVINGWDSLKPYRVGIMKGMKAVENNSKGIRSEQFN